MSRTSQPHDTASEAGDEFETLWRSFWLIFAVQRTLNNLCFFLFTDRQIPQIFEFIEGGRPESSQYYVSIADAWQVLSAVLFRSAFRNCLLPPNVPWLCCIILLHNIRWTSLWRWLDMTWFGSAVRLKLSIFDFRFITFSTRQKCLENSADPTPA